MTHCIKYVFHSDPKKSKVLIKVPVYIMWWMCPPVFHISAQLWIILTMYIHITCNVPSAPFSSFKSCPQWNSLLTHTHRCEWHTTFILLSNGNSFWTLIKKTDKTRYLKIIFQCEWRINFLLQLLILILLLIQDFKKWKVQEFFYKFSNYTSGK